MKISISLVSTMILSVAALGQTGIAQPAKEETLALTAPPACKFIFKVVEGKGLNGGSISMLRGMGYGVKGVPEGTGLPVKCDDVDGSGWINAAGDLQAFIAPAKGWLFDKTNDPKPIKGSLHIITRSFTFDGRTSEGTYIMYSGSPLGQFSIRLLNDIGIAVKGNTSQVLVKLGDGQKLKGTISAKGLVTGSEEPWPN